VARFARDLGRNRGETLNSILVARGFNGFQFAELIKRLNPVEATGPVIISGFCSAFFDEDMSENDASRLFYRALYRIRDLAVQGIAFLITQSREIVSARRAHFLRDLFKASDYIFRLDRPDIFTIESRRHVPISICAPAEKE
jgi:hypothetical protein